MEVITTIATVAQLLSYAVNSIDSVIALYQTLKEGSGRLENHLARIKTLYHTIRIIKNNKLLIEKDIRFPLERLILSIQELRVIAERLQSRLSRSIFSRWVKTSIQNADFNKLEESVRHIEADKATLTLSITHAHATAFLQDRQRRTLIPSHSSQGQLLLIRKGCLTLKI